ncbi:MAG TPA: GNAT family N-acetyltransferase [Bauldia sp.]|nr:GNAT family N-acetyltransferase [Bauldia sp.]
MAVRLAEARDLTLVERLTHDAYARYQTEIGIVPGPVLEDYAPRIARGDVWLLSAGGEVVGLIVLEARPGHLFVFSVAVAPDHQREGHGLALLRFADARATALGLNEVRLYTNSLMARNIALYERFGYGRTGLRPHPTRAGHAIVDMAKALG